MQGDVITIILTGPWGGTPRHIENKSTSVVRSKVKLCYVSDGHFWIPQNTNLISFKVPLNSRPWFNTKITFWKSDRVLARHCITTAPLQSVQKKLV